MAGILSRISPQWGRTGLPISVPTTPPDEIVLLGSVCVSSALRRLARSYSSSAPKPKPAACDSVSPQRTPNASTTLAPSVRGSEDRPTRSARGSLSPGFHALTIHDISVSSPPPATASNATHTVCLCSYRRASEESRCGCYAPLMSTQPNSLKPQPKVAAAGGIALVLTTLFTILAASGVVVPGDVQNAASVVIVDIATFVPVIVAYIKSNV